MSEAEGAAAQFLREHGFSALMRYFMCGGVGTLLWFARRPADLVELGSPSSGSVALLLLASVIVGILTYTFHTALPFPLVRSLVSHCKSKLSCKTESKSPCKTVSKSLFLTVVGLSTKEAKRAASRWERRGKLSRGQRELDLWAAHIHFLFCSAYLSVAIVIVPPRYTPEWQCSRLYFLVLAGLLLFAALSSTARFVDMEREVNLGTEEETGVGVDDAVPVSETATETPEGGE